MVKALRAFEQRVRREAAWSLGELGGQEAVHGLVSVLNHRDAMLVSEAEQALRKLNDPEMMPGLIEVLATGGEGARLAAIRLLGDLGLPEAASGLIPALDDPESLVQSQAAEALGRIGATQAIPHLLAKLRGSPTSAVSAARALRQLGSRHGVRDELQDLRAPRDLAEEQGRRGAGNTGWA